ncbi:hypothetical protein QF036_002445 [Arthrobacter globiformis]|nr:hypothetical protein [Arthrobacter globiformis]
MTFIEPQPLACSATTALPSSGGGFRLNPEIGATGGCSAR